MDKPKKLITKDLDRNQNFRIRNKKIKIISKRRVSIKKNYIIMIYINYLYFNFLDGVLEKYND
jgi:hypothetical protein